VRSAVFTLALLAGCQFEADYGGTGFRCSDGQACPGGSMCVDGVCRAGGDPDAGSGDSLAHRGDLIMMTFDDFEPTNVVHDRSGNGHDAGDTERVPVAGKFGLGARFAGETDLEIPDAPDLFAGNHLTIEAWVKLSVTGVAQAIYSDQNSDSDSGVEASFEIGADDRLLFTSNDGCGAPMPVTVAADEGSEIAAAVWVHVAVTWDGEQVAFYRDGEAAGVAPLASAPCEGGGLPTVGTRSNTNTVGLQGDLDEFKLSSYAKTAAEIRVSMAYDSSPLIGACGDQLVEMDECEGDNPCCDATCGVRADGDDCAADAACSDGVCAVGGGRVAGGLVALYRFDEGNGTSVTDEVAPPLDLTIADPAGVTWGDGTLRVDDPTAITSDEVPSKIIDACQGSLEMTLEAWVEPAEVGQDGSILRLGEPESSDHAKLEQLVNAYAGYMHTRQGGDASAPRVDSPPGDVAAGALVHLVATRDAAGERRLYVDGVQRGRNVSLGDFGAWGDADRLSLARDGTDDWLGTFHLVAIYCRALSTLEVAQNFTAGAD
jgi:hypothetical protein